MGSLTSDLRYSLRAIRRNWRFSLGVVLTLSIGIGANTLVYSVVDGVVLHPFAFPDPDRLVGVGSEWPQLSRELGFFETLSPAEYQDVRTQSRTLEGVAMWDMDFMSVTLGSERPELLMSAKFFDDVFPTLRLNPALGRGFSRDELDRGDPVAIVSYRIWRTRLGGGPDVLGRAIEVNGEPYTIVGVMAPRGQLIASDLWIPIGARPEEFPRDARRMQMLARIKPAYSLAEVNAELATISGRIEQEYGAEFKEYATWRMRALPWTEVNVRLARPAALALLGAVSVVLLIVCANVGSLLLARSATRRREIALRGALGAGRSAIVRQLLMESLVVSLVAAALALAVTQLGVSTLVPRLVARIPFVVVDIGLNIRVLLFTCSVALVTGLAFGLVPALHGTRSSVFADLKSEGGAAIGSISRRRLQRIFVGSEVAVALVLLALAGLMTNSFVHTLNVDPGFDTSKALTMRLTLPPQRYPDRATIDRFFDELIRRVGELPEVVSAAAGSNYPPNLLARRTAFELEGRYYQTDEERPTAFLTTVSDHYHQTLGISLREGRPFRTIDRLDTPRVALINEAAGRHFFADGEPIGERLKVGGADGAWFEVVGVVTSVHNRGPEVQPQPEVFVNLRQLERESNQLFLIVRARDDPRSLAERIEQEVAVLDPDQSVYAVVTLDEAYAAIVAPRLAGALTLVLLAVFALALAGVGIYAVVAFSVVERRREIGLRVAMGPSGRQIVHLVVRQALMPVLVGGTIGLALALGSGRAMEAFLFGVSTTDPLTLLGVTVVLLTLAALASYLPARRASRLDPTVALRDE